MIVLCGIPTEPPLAMVSDRLNEMGVVHLVVNQRAFDTWDISWSVVGGQLEGTLMVGGQRVDLRGVTGAYVRLMDDRLLPELDNALPESERRLICRNRHQALASWIDIAPGRFVNRFREMGSNASKPYQAQLIRTYGFSIPDTLVTNDPATIRDFAGVHPRVVYKSISGFRSIVTELQDSDLERIEDIASCPVQFQEFVDGTDIRVHTVGDAVFATRINSRAIDYRYASHTNEEVNLEPIELSPDLRERCLKLAAGLGLSFAGIDLRMTSEGAVYCFEVNPSPAYSYYENQTGQPISAAVAMYLAG